MRRRHGEWHCRSVFLGGPCPAQRRFFVSAFGIRLLRRLHQSLSRAPTNWPHVIAPCLLSATALLASPFSTTCLTLAVVRRYSSLLSALGGPLVPPSPAAAVALVGHLSNMRNDQSRLRAAAAVVGAGSLTASGHLRVLEAAACAGAPHLLLPLHDVTRLHPQMRFGMRRYLPRVILKTVCWNGCASARRTLLRASAALCPRCWPTTTCSSTAQAIPFASPPVLAVLHALTLLPMRTNLFQMESQSFAFLPCMRLGPGPCTSACSCSRRHSPTACPTSTLCSPYAPKCICRCSL